MNILSWNFALFALAALLVYYFLPRRLQNTWLLGCSLFFYAAFGWKLLLLLLATTLFNYLVGLRVGDGVRRRPWLWIGIGANLCSLLVLRILVSNYGGVFLAPLELAGLNPQELLVQIYLPVGFSFYVMQAVSYLLDVSQKRMSPCRDLPDFALYMAYFPKMVSGPIERAKPFLAILANPRRVDAETLKKSFTLILLGLVRKMVIADALFRLAGKNAFAPPTEGALPPWIGLLAYAFYIYCDFSGYTDIVRGISGLFGIELSRNFQNPYLSRNLSEFWTRWHITLSNWLKEYIFFPLSRSLLRRVRYPQNLANILVPPLTTMLASGLWHGFSPAMLLWGALHGGYLALERVVLLRFPALRPQEQGPWVRVISTLVTFVLVVLAWVPFGMNIFKLSFVFWGRLFSAQSLAAPGIGGALVLALVGLCLVIDLLQEHARDELVFLHWPVWAQAAAIFIALNLFFLVSMYSGFPQVQEFVYKGF